MGEPATAIETNEDGSITYVKDKYAGYMLEDKGKIPYVWPEDLIAEYDELNEHESLTEFLKDLGYFGLYVWIDGQPFYKLDDGEYVAIEYSKLSEEGREAVFKGDKQESPGKRIFNVNKEDFEDYLAKEWTVKDKDSERRIER